MARIYPQEREPEHDSERRVLAALRALDDEWTVFHNIKWQALRRNRQGDGETDFALFHPTKGILVIEAKGGEIVLDGQNFKRVIDQERTKTITNPFDQAAACKRQLSEFLAGSVIGLEHGPRVGHAVAFPQGRVEADMGPQGPRAIIMDSTDLADIAATMDRISSHWDPPTALDTEQLEAIRRLLLPSVRVRRLLVDAIADADQAIITLTEEQYEVLDGLSANRQALITGGAGTGKTVLAAEQVRRLASLGPDAKVLFVCFNRPLADVLEATFADHTNVTAVNLHRLVRNTIATSGIALPTNVTPAWWANDAIEQFPDAAARLGFEVDAVVIDEGQDFQAHWWDALRLVMRDPDDGWFYVFADAQQAVYVDDWQPPFEANVARWTLSKNCRNSDQIASKVARLFGNKARTLGVDGPKPRFHEMKSRSGIVESVVSRVGELIDEGIQSDQIQLVSTSRRFVNELQEALGETIAVETIQRFKGLESPVVLVVFTDDITEGDLALAYTGFSRARTLLEVFGSSATKQAIRWDALS